LPFHSTLQIDYLLHLADTNLILTQRNSEWCGHGPILEQDIALTNISLDLLGQARNFYQHAASLINEKNPGEPLTEDSLAYLRTERDFKNLLLAELPNGDWGQTILRQFLFSSFQYLLYQHLQAASDVQLSAIAEKALKEVTYHVRWSGEWVVRLGDGTSESHQRMQQAVDALWPYTGEMFLTADFEQNLKSNMKIIQEEWLRKVTHVLNEATLSIPENVFMQQGGKKGLHTEHLGYILAEMQHLQRAYPNSNW
jgi:ring-1,2-phenylacetyl-CoA epoxidase subunit PaaC